MADVAALAKGTSNPALDELLLDAADTLADIDQQARVLCGTCGPEAALAPPEALSSGSGAATVDNLLARPVKQAQVDVAAVEAARNAALKAGASAAEATASTIPQVDDPTGAGGSGSGGSADGPPPVNSTITQDGGLVPSLPSGGSAVTDLVTGVTSTVDEVTGKIVKPGSPLDEVVQGLNDSLDKTTEEILPQEQE